MDAALFALELAMFVGRSRVPSTLVWRWMLLRCLRCSSLQCRQELRTFSCFCFRWMFLRSLRCSSLCLLAAASCLCLWFWFEWIWLRCLRCSLPYVCWQVASGYYIISRWIWLRCLRCSSLRLSACACQGISRHRAPVSAFRVTVLRNAAPVSTFRVTVL